MRPSRDARTPVALAFTALLALPGGLLAHEPAPEEATAAPAPAPATQGSECPVLREADAMLDQAGSASEAAVRWLSANVSPEAVSAIAESARTAAECRWRALVAAARDQCERDLGTLLYTPSSGTACGGDWTPIADLAHLGTRPRAVLLVHGLDEPGDIWNDLAPELATAGFVVARFNYPNDQHPADSAERLADAVRALRRDLGAERVDLVCHSMGGLIARDLLTRPTFYAGEAAHRQDLPRVGRLITIGTPNHGSPLAPLRALAEAREHLARWMESDATDARALLGFLTDGDGAAADALDPGSPYLAELNARPLPTGVEITVIIGRISPVTGQDVGDLLSESWVASALGAERTERLRAQAARVVACAGDAIVSVESARLDGVEDTVILEANHRSLVRSMALLDSVRGLVGCDGHPTPPAIPVILSRLTEE